MCQLLDKGYTIPYSLSVHQVLRIMIQVFFTRLIWFRSRLFFGKNWKYQIKVNLL
jgi:hypothetical protein